jgi:hypothetical protein
MVDPLELLGQVVGILIAGGLTLAVVVLLQRPVERFLLHLLKDPVVARMGTLFMVVLLSLHGLATVLDFITQPQIHLILGGVSGLLLRMAEVVQWLAQVAALLFVGYALMRGSGIGDRGSVGDRGTVGEGGDASYEVRER